MAFIIREGRVDDSFGAFRVFVDSVAALGEQVNMETITGEDRTDMESLWASRRPLFDHLAEHATRWWVAEDEGCIVGCARSLLRDGVLQLSDFFVSPSYQSAGVGRELISRAFPKDGDYRQRIIIATFDVRATARYLKQGVYQRFPIYHFSREARRQQVQTDLTIERVSPSAKVLSQLRQVDVRVLGYQRDVEHKWLLEHHTNAYLYRQGDEVVGYGYENADKSGPFALLNTEDFPAVLAYAEDAAAQRGARFGFEVGTVNQVVVDYALDARFTMDEFFVFFMTDVLLGHYENYVFTCPSFFL